MMKKANVLCIMVALVMLFQAAQAQVLTGSQLNLGNSYPDPKNGSVSLFSNWSLQFVNNNQLAFTNSGLQKFRITSGNVYSEVPFTANVGITSLSTIHSNTYIVADQKIGIGTATPLEALHISNGVAKAGGFIVDGNSTQTSNWGGSWYGLSSGTNAPVLDNYTQIKPVVLQGFGGVALRTASGRLTMDRDGIVTIGLDDAKITSIAANTDNTHEYSLYIAKGIRSERSRVDLNTNWPDFVFEENYDLTPLDELEIFIQKNHHLPNIPNAATVQAEGIDLGDMDAKLLQKIEELTLYVIDLKKEVEALKAEKE